VPQPHKSTPLLEKTNRQNDDYYQYGNLTQFVSVTPRPPYFNQPDDKRIRFSALAFPISPVLPLRASYRSELQNLLRVVPARQPLCPDVSIFDQTDRTPGWYREFICRSSGTCQTIHQAQLGAPVQDTREVCGRRYFLPFALMRRPPTSDIPIAVCRVAFAHVIAVDHRGSGSWSLVERCPAITWRTSVRRQKA
jgi:hypothetical protein